MKKDSADIPKWLQWEGEPPKPEVLTESRKEMYEALTLFHNHVRYVIYIMITMPTIIFAIVRLWPTAQFDELSVVIAGFILLFVLPIGFISIFVIHKYYQVYVSALVFATSLHTAVGYKHPWFERTVKQANDWKKEVNNSLEFLGRRSKSFRDTFIFYSLIIGILAFASGACGIILLFFG